MELTTQILHMPEDYEGHVIATLISAKCGGTAYGSSDKAVLYIHGYIDYFFQEHMAAEFCDKGWNFHALDLRKYGRSILSLQHPYYCRSLDEYFADIDKAIEVILYERNKQVVLIGHSTGGLIASLYAARGRYKDNICQLILNSPFFEFNTSLFKINISIPMAAFISRIFPYAHKRNELSPLYAPSVHRSMKGEWNFDLRLKPAEGVPLYFSWLGAIRKGQKELKNGLHIDIPILIIHSDASYSGKRWSDKYLSTDTVLNVDDITRYGSYLGSDVTDIAIPGAMHDVVLSAENVRRHAFDVIFGWLSQKSRV